MADMDRFSGDMSRNEVELDLSKFMELLQEQSKLKDRIRELEDQDTRNPWQKVIFLLYYATMWFMELPEPSLEQSGLISIIVGAGAAWFGLYAGTSKGKTDH